MKLDNPDHVALIVSCASQDALAMAVLTVVYKLVVTEALWGSLVAAWAPWSEASFIMAATFLTHESMYLGARPRPPACLRSDPPTNTRARLPPNCRQASTPCSST